MAEKSEGRLIDQRLVLAIGHPVRSRILGQLIAAGELSSSALATRLGERPSSVGYHLTVLRQCGAVEVARTEEHRGGPEQFFRPVPESLAGDGSWQQIPAAAKDDISTLVIKDFVERTSDFEPRGRA